MSYRHFIEVTVGHVPRLHVVDGEITCRNLRPVSSEYQGR
jgi:hypothetical protein